MKIRILVGIASPNWALKPGAVVELDPEEARKWIGANIAEAISIEIETEPEGSGRRRRRRRERHEPNPDYRPDDN